MKIRLNVFLFSFAIIFGFSVFAVATPLHAQENGAEHEHVSRPQALYSCPMHPQIVQDTPGTCPVCGMDLVPEKVGTEAAESGRAAAASGQRKIKYWVAPMDPTFISDKPGKSPMGMDLVPVYEEGGNASTISIDPVVVQNMGVRISPVRRGSIFRHVRTIGTVEVAENLISVVNLRYSGWIERIYVDETGVLVEKGQPLFDIYSPELVSAQDEYLMALRTSGVNSSLTKSARNRLELWEFDSEQIDRIAKRGRVLRTLTVVAPQKGYVLHKDVVLGARVREGTDLYRIGDLDTVWIYAEVYEFDAPWVNIGDRTTMELTFQPGKTYEGAVTYIYPTLDPKTRTLKVRLEFENPGVTLKPGMFATVQIEAQRLENVVLVPTEAIIRSGTRQIVFIAVDLGRYEMREIVSGVVGDRYVTEVISGLSEGERVVTSGQFLLDSESQLQEAVQKLLAARLHARENRVFSPDDQASSKNHDHGADSYWTCGMHPNIVQEESGTCPICGMDLVERKK